MAADAYQPPKAKPFIPTEAQKHQLTLEALAEVDAGDVVSQEKVRAWIESLDGPNPLPVPLE